MSEGRFREDLYFRLNVFPIELPPLRERLGDVIPMANRFIDRYSSEKPFALSDEAEEKLLRHRWRGNIRELGNCLHRACILASGGEISQDDIIFDELVEGGLGDVASTQTPVSDDLKGNERDMIINALRDSRGNRKVASERLGISGRTLRYKLARYKEQGYDIPVTTGA